MPFYDQSFDQPISAGELYRGDDGMAPQASQGSYQDPYMDMGSVGAYEGLSGFNGGMGMSGMQQPPPDPTLTSMQYGISDNEQQPSYAPQIQGEGSWFKKLLSSAVLGMAGGAGAPDAATAFSAGYQTVVQQRQQEQQMLMQQQKMKQEQEMFELSRASKMAEMLKFQFEVSKQPEEYQRAKQESDIRMMMAMKKDGFEPDGAVDYSPEALKQAKEVSDAKPWLYDYFNDGEKIYMYKADPQKIAVNGHMSDIGGVQRNWEAGKHPWSEIREWEDQQWKLFYQKQADERNFQQSRQLSQESAAQQFGNQKAFLDYQQQMGPSQAQLGVQGREDTNNKIQFAQGQISQIGYDIKDLETELSQLQQVADNNPKSVSEEMGLRMQQIPEEIKQLKGQMTGVNDEWSMMANPQKPVSGTLPESLPFQDQMLSTLQQLMGKVIELPPPYGRVKVLGVDPATGQVQLQPVKTR